MKIATINLPDKYVTALESLVELGFYPSRSEVCREAIKQFLIREGQFDQQLEIEAFKTLKQGQMEKMIQL